MASAEGGRLVPSACGGRHLTFCSLQATVDSVIEVRETETFSRWLRTLRDPTAKAKVAARVRRLAFGNPPAMSGPSARESANCASNTDQVIGSITCSVPRF